jgi:hypothetical protein
MTVVFVVEWPPEARGRQPLRADLVDESGREVLTIQGHTDVEPRPEGAPPAQTRLVMPLEEVVFPEAGRYDFRLRAGDQVRRACSVFVREVRAPDPSG